MNLWSGAKQIWKESHEIKMLNKKSVISKKQFRLTGNHLLHFSFYSSLVSLRHIYVISATFFPHRTQDAAEYSDDSRGGIRTEGD